MIFRTLKMRTPLYFLGFGALGQLFLVISRTSSSPVNTGLSLTRDSVVCAHIALLHTIEGIWSVRARWDMAAHGCAVVAWQSTLLGVQYLYSASHPY